MKIFNGAQRHCFLEREVFENCAYTTSYIRGQQAYNLFGWNLSQNRMNKYICQESRGNGGLKVPTGRGGQLIIAHAGSESTGFIAGAKPVSYTHLDVYKRQVYTWSNSNDNNRQ